MNVGIIGLPQTGKKTLFELLVGKTPADGGEQRKTVRGVAEVRDTRFDDLLALYKPKKESRARLDILLPQKIEEASVTQGDIFRDLGEVEVFCHVVRAFQDDAIYHTFGSVDPARDIDYVNGEFLLHDLVFVEKRIERLDKDLQKVKSDAGRRERDLLERLRKPLEDERPLRLVDIDPEDEKIIKSYPLLSRRAMICVLNVSEDDVRDEERLHALAARYDTTGIVFVQVAGRTELEIAALETVTERSEFMEAIGIKDTALHLLTRECIGALGLVSFFTAGPNELRQWFVRRGSDAVQAAGKIHSDLARGFIRAEVIKSADLVALGSEDAVKAAGKLAVKGRDYIVEDGDILFVRFNV